MLEYLLIRCVCDALEKRGGEERGEEEVVVGGKVCDLWLHFFLV